MRRSLSIKESIGKSIAGIIVTLVCAILPANSGAATVPTADLISGIMLHVALF